MYLLSHATKCVNLVEARSADSRYKRPICHNPQYQTVPPLRPTTRKSRTDPLYGYRDTRDAFELAEQVRAARERADITQEELAARIGNTQPAIARLEAGGVTPNLTTLRRIAAALGLDLVVQLRLRRVAA